ncbi:MAG: rhodanese-like domain-containing protein [Trueperaceae bacterium]|nr:rhodanese-like domain-containing protein [Trueperaceae bacterium]
MYQDIFPEELSQWQRKGASLIDVREPYEFEMGHVPGTKNIPLGELSVRISEVPDNVVLICASGNRSGRAAGFLSQQGYHKVANLMGGTQGWMMRGREIEL